MQYVFFVFRAGIYQHCAKNHIPKEYVNLRYPFLEDELAVITSRNEDKYNSEVNPRNLPLQPGILLPREHLPVDTNTPSGLEWYTPACDPSSRITGSPLPLAPSQRSKRLKTDPSLDCRLCQKEGCFMICGNAVVLSATKCASTRFQMQLAINANRPLPFPTPAERDCLLGAYDSSFPMSL